MPTRVLSSEVGGGRYCCSFTALGRLQRAHPLPPLVNKQWIEEQGRLVRVLISHFGNVWAQE